ncbi:MAG: TAXI family TRAP transporter solute-binding subunit [Rhodobacteraceae bacterium]|nr:TAXI family TRAP transporter solute-binding subunit [Paracoccaceae bacterium]
MSPFRLSTVLHIASALSLGLCAAIPAANAQQVPEIKVVRIATGPTDSTLFPFGGLIGNAISNPPGSRPCDRGGSCGVPGLIATAQTTGGPLDNLRAVARGDIELGLSDSDIAEWVYRGSYEFEGQEPLNRLRLIAQLYPATLHLIARKAAKITSVKDLAGKTVAVDGEGTGTRYTARVVLAAYDVPWDAVTMKTLDLTAAPAAFKAGEIDAMFVIGGTPVLALSDLARADPFDVIPIDGPTAEKIAQVLPYYTVDQIPADAYAGVPATPTLAVGAVLVARDDMSDDLAFGIARAIWHERNASLFAAGHPRGKLMSKARAAGDLRLPLHPGAARYYIAQGIIAPPAETPAAETPAPQPDQPAAKPAAPARAASAAP